MILMGWKENRHNIQKIESGRRYAANKAIQMKSNRNLKILFGLDIDAGNSGIEYVIKEVVLECLAPFDRLEQNSFVEEKNYSQRFDQAISGV